MATLNTLIRKASVLLRLSSQENPFKISQLEGEVIYCKNNVCVHPPVSLRSEIDHHPGYLCIKAQHDEALGNTLVLSWIPNSTLSRNPRSLEKRTPGSSPCRSSRSSACPSPITGSCLPPHSGSQSPLTGNDKILGQMGSFYRSGFSCIDQERQSISSTMSDLGSPRDDLQSLDSWTTSDFGAEMTTSLTSSLGLDTIDDKLSPSAVPSAPTLPVPAVFQVAFQNEKFHSKSQSDSGIGPEEVTAALESMISGLNDIGVLMRNGRETTETENGSDHTRVMKNCLAYSPSLIRGELYYTSKETEHHSSHETLTSSSCDPVNYSVSEMNGSENSTHSVLTQSQIDTSQKKSNDFHLESSSYICSHVNAVTSNVVVTSSTDNMTPVKEDLPETDEENFSICAISSETKAKMSNRTCSIKDDSIGNLEKQLSEGETFPVEKVQINSEILACDNIVNCQEKVVLRLQISKSSSTTPTTSNKDPDSCPSTPANSVPPSPLRNMKFLYVEGTAESVAHAHNLTFPDGHSLGSCNSPNKVTSSRESSCGLFSVDLSQMRSLRLFFCDKEHTCGQLVIASRESQYKILHFHNGGLDKLAKVFEDWSFLCKSNSKSENCPYRQFSVSRPEVSAEECHPEEGIYGLVDEGTWREFINQDGQIDDDFQFRKNLFFGGLDQNLRKEVWPFLLHHYGFQTTFDEREQIRNDKYIEYQTIRRRRENMSEEEKDMFWKNVQCTVEKDVVRTDRSKHFFAGEDNPNIEIMKNILLNYAIYNPGIGYTQGMSDLLAPVLAEVQDESEAFWCFLGLMQRTIFFSSPRDSDMDANLNYLQELLRLMTPEYHSYLQSVKDGLELLFAHRWILLCFKREFPEAEALRMWESCWAHYQTDYFHLFVCLAIVAIYGEDVRQQGLRADEMLLHFSSLAMHMEGELVLTKARGLLHQFRLLPVIPCTLAKLCELCGPGMWDSGHVPIVECTGHKEGQLCTHIPLAATGY